MARKHERRVQALLRELAEQHGATVEFDYGGKHRKYIVAFNGGTRCKPYTSNCNDEVGQLAHIRREFRRVIEELRQ